jgi:MFS family permease
MGIPPGGNDISDDLRTGLAAGAELALPPPDPRRWKALILLCMTGFMVVLDSQIVILALPSIERDFDVSAGGGQWVLSAYMLAFGGLLLFGGRLADLRGRRQMFMVGTALFLVSSLLCGFAWSAAVLVGARVVQGVSAALMAPTSLAILMGLFPEGPERNKAFAFWSGVGGVGATAALLIGGPITDTVGWTWIFFINVPVAVVMLVFAPILFPESREKGGRRGYDPAGALTSTLGLMLFIGAIVLAPAKGWLSGPVLGMLLGSVVLLVYIIEGLLKNASELKPTTIHADTQGQSYPVFALAHLLGFDLMPRIRNWKDLTFYRPSRQSQYVHIDALFGESGQNVIDFDLIESQFRHLMRVAVSVREGQLSSTLLLRRLRSGSRRNATYTAFREVGRVIRTVQMLRYLSDPAMRRRVTAATNKVESYNGFMQWLYFGNRGIITDNDPVEQEKAMKFNALLTNAVIFHQATDIAMIVRELQAEGWKVEPEDLAEISPYITENINRFGEYSTHELGIVPDAYEPHLDVGFTKLRDGEAA